MFYESWMDYIRDDVKLTELVIPGSHDSGTYQMLPLAKCQSQGLFRQYQYGVRAFDFRFHVTKKGKIVFEHGIESGSEMIEGLQDLRRMLDRNPSELFILDIHNPHREKLLGIVDREYRRDYDRINELFDIYLDPKGTAFTDAAKINDLTIGEMRAAGKRLILIRQTDGIHGTVKAPLFKPWSSKIHGLKLGAFQRETLKYFDEAPDDGFFMYFTQRTPGIGTQEGLKTAHSLEMSTRKRFGDLMQKIADDPEKLKRANLIMGDFMTEDTFKVNRILMLNLKKGFVKPEREEEFRYYADV